MSARTVRTTRTRLLTAAVAAATAALSLTACGGASDTAGGVRTEGKATAEATTGQETDSDTDTDTDTEKSPPPAPKPSTAGGTSDDKAPSGNSGTTEGESTTAPRCGGDNTRTAAAPVKRPLNHLLLTVTNTGSTRCDLVGYPAVRFGEAQAVPPVLEDTKPQAVVSLDPGESGYAGVRLSAADGSGTDGYTATTLTVYFDDDSSAAPALPADGVHVDSSLAVTYWQQSLATALR